MEPSHVTRSLILVSRIFYVCVSQLFVLLYCYIFPTFMLESFVGPVESRPVFTHTRTDFLCSHAAVCASQPDQYSCASSLLCELMWWRTSDNSLSFLLSVSRRCPSITLGPFITPLIQWLLFKPLSVQPCLSTYRCTIKPCRAYGFFFSFCLINK